MNAIKLTKISAAALIFVAAPVFADGEIRGGVTAVSIVAGSVAAEAPHNGFRWGQKRPEAAPLVNTQEVTAHSGVRWADRNKQGSAAGPVADSNQAASRWIIRTDGGQAASRWIIRNDGSQAASRWIIRNDGSQAASRWIIRSDVNQSASRWIIR